MRSRSILIGVTFAYLACLACGFVVADVIAQRNYDTAVTPTFQAMDYLELDQARSALSDSGQAGLKDYMESLDRAFGGHHFLLSTNGTDMADGISRASLLPKPPSTRFRGYIHGVFYLAQQSEDGQYWFAVIGTDNDTGPGTWTYFAVCIFVTTALLLFALLYLVFPLRRIRDAMSSFGSGQMTSRIASPRRDEIGQLAATFDAMAERIEQSFRTERLLLQDVSHELRAPLARLSLAVHLARQDRDDELLNQIESNVKKLSALVAEITEFHQKWSSVENSRPLETVDLEPVVRDAVRDCSIEAAAQSISLTMHSEPVILKDARPALIGRVIENILRNAILHSQTGARIEVTLTRTTSDAVITVRDFGRGVAPELLDRIFDPFYREPDGSSQDANGRSPGLGLGLSIARRGAQWHGGTLQAENAGPGLRLIATFPLAELTSLRLRNNS